jgi:hypothetical protein
MTISLRGVSAPQVYDRALYAGFSIKETAFSEHLMEASCKPVEEIRGEGSSVNSRICFSALMGTMSYMNGDIAILDENNKLGWIQAGDYFKKLNLPRYRE